MTAHPEKPDAETPAAKLLRRLSAGDAAAGEELFPLVYGELHRIAQRCVLRERAGHTLQATALVHEAYLKLAGAKEARFEDQQHFFRIAARAMREVLVDHSRGKNARKRGGGAERITLSELAETFGDRAPQLLDLDEALTALARLDDQLGRIVELRFFGGLTADETARVLGLSLRTVERGWRTARAWLRDRMASGGDGGGGSVETAPRDLRGGR